MPSAARTAKLLLAIIILSLGTYEIFFTLYRIMIFQTVPRDDYAPYLLWLVHASGGQLPGSPYIYRFLSVALAWPLYHLLPAVPLTNIPVNIPHDYERATGAMALLSDLSAIVAVVLCFDFARRLGESALVGILSGVLVYAGCWFTQIEGIDPVTILGIMIVAMLLRAPDWCWIVLIPLMFVNEKIGIITFLFLALRCVTSKADCKLFSRKLAWVLLALAAYCAVLFLIRAQGNSYQVTPSGYAGHILANMRTNFSTRGLLLSWGPCGLFILLALLSEHNSTLNLFSPRDVLLIPALMLVGLVLTTDFQLGRIVMMSMPLFAIPGAVRIARLLDPPLQPPNSGQKVSPIA